MKLFPKLALMVSALVIGTTVCLSLSFYLTERRSIRTEADQERHALLQNLTLIAQESFLTNDDLLLVKYTRWLQKWTPSLVSASVVSPQGEVLAHSEPSDIGKSISDIPPEAGRDEVLVLTQPVHLGSQWVATASASFSEKQFEETVQNRLRVLQRRLAFIAGGAVGVGIMISFILALSWTRPIGTLAKAAERVGQGKYSLDLAGTTHRRDELGFLSKAFQTMAEQLHELDQMKEDFVSAVTHELRSPLGAIESYLNLIQEEILEGISPSTWETYLERLRVNTQRLTRFVNDLLDVAALERGKIMLERRSVNVAILIQDVVALYAAKLADRKLLCQTHIPDALLPEAWADPDKIRQVLVNLLSNAIKFTPERGTIDVGLSRYPGEESLPAGQAALRVYVKDTGLGIAPEDQAKIFNKFEQVHSARRNIKGPKGTGLGLSICRALVELHGGILGVESKPGEGSCFYFTLPTAPAAAGRGHSERIKGDLV
jgi:signal transduction histidine kinase